MRANQLPNLANKQKALAAMAAKLRDAISNPAVFVNDRVDVEAFIGDRESDFPYLLRAMLWEFSQSPVSRIPGHSQSHVVDHMAANLRALQGFSLSELEKFEVFLASLMHDFGRMAESFMPDYFKKDLAILMPLLWWRDFLRSLGIPWVIVQRALYSIDSNFVPMTDNLAANIMHQSDREQILGGAIHIREISLGLGTQGASFGLPAASKMEGFKTDLSNPYQKRLRWLFLEHEFYLRNVYPAATPDGQKAQAELKKASVALLMLGLNEEIRDIVFYPELRGASSDDLAKTKKPIPLKIFEAGIELADEFFESRAQSFQELEIETALKALTIEGEERSPEIEARIRRLIGGYGNSEKINFWLATEFALHQRSQQRRAFLDAFQVPLKGVAEVIRQWVVSEYQKREERYQDYLKK
jgi:hypothetical protein